MSLWRDSSGRLTIDLEMEAIEYPALCRRIRDQFELVPVGELLIGPDQMYWNFRRDDLEIGLDWDVWMGFMAVAQSKAAEPLLQSIADWLIANYGERIGPQ